MPLRLPAGVTLSSLGVGRIAVIVDPENMINETFKNNNTADLWTGDLEGDGNGWLKLRTQSARPGTTFAREAARCTREGTQTDRREGAFRRQTPLQDDRRRNRVAWSTP